MRLIVHLIVCAQICSFALSRTAFADELLMSIEVQINFPDGEEKTYRYVLKEKESKELPNFKFPTTCSLTRTSREGFVLTCRDIKSSLKYGSIGSCNQGKRTSAALTVLEPKSTSFALLTGSCSQLN